MTIGVPTFRGRRLEQARRSRGLTMSALAGLIGVTRSAISRYEQGEDKPQYDRVIDIAGHLNFPMNFFLQPEWPEAVELVFWRSRNTESKLAREMTEQRMTWMCEIFSFLEREVDFPDCRLPDIKVPQDFRLLTGDQIERMAEDLRAASGFDIRPIPDMFLALENWGIPVANVEIESEKQDGFCFRSPQLARTFVGVNTLGISACRARLDAAHELGHVVLHRDVTSAQERDPALHKIIEQQAFRFAGAFLFPRSSFQLEVRSPTLDYFCALKKKWGMSVGAMIYRAHDLRIIDDYERTALYRGMTRRGWRGRLAEPFDSSADMSPERPRMLRRGLEAVLDGGVYERSTFQREIALPDAELEQILGLDPGFFRADGNVTRLATLKKHPVRVPEVESGSVVEFRKRR